MSYYFENEKFNVKNSLFQPPTEARPNSTIISTSIPTISPTQPPVPFDWPTNAVNIVDKLLSVGFKLYKRKDSPTHNTPVDGNKHHEGHEQYDYYVYQTGWKVDSEDAETGFPDLAKLFIPTDGVHTSPFMDHPTKPSKEHQVICVGIVHFGPWSCGHPGIVFGGLLTAVCDISAYIPYHCYGRSGVTASLAMNFKTMTPTNQILLSCITMKIADDDEYDQARIKWGLFSETMDTVYCDADVHYVTPTAWKGMTQAEVDEMNSKR